MMAPETVVTVDHNKPNQQQAPPQQQGGALDWIKINVEYFKTPPGMLKVIQLASKELSYRTGVALAIQLVLLMSIAIVTTYYQVLGILCMALGTPWASTWYVFVAVTAFITTLMWSLVYFLSIREALKIPINWVLSELISTSLETLFYFIAFIVMFATTYGNFGRNIAAAVFGLFNTVAYAASSYLLYQEHRSSVVAASA